VLVDRGAADGLLLQDRVTFRARDGQVFEGAISELQPRSAVVLLDDPSRVPPPGTRGIVRIPSSRRAAAPAPPAQPVPPVQPGAQEPVVAPREPLPWQNPDEEWQEGEPLLARVRAVRPAERAPRITGRWYAIGDALGSSEGSRSDVFLRTGAGGEYENPFGDGGVLKLDGELNWRDVDVPDDDDDERARGRLDRLSYTWGGTRFAPTRVEAGRFLQHALPEFGVLDGIEVVQRTRGGASFGGSVGYMPEPDAEQSTGTDLQFAGFYRWVNDESETVSAAAGYQKTFHDFDADRDLFVAKLDVVPRDAWSFRSTLWVDVYGSSDDEKGSGVEVTQAYVQTGRTWNDGGSIGITYTHFAFPEIEREEFLPVADDQLADDHSERIALLARKPLGDTWAANIALGAWMDEEDEGGDVELGFDSNGSWTDGGRLELAGFATEGDSASLVGGRFSFGRAWDANRWHVDYEFQRDLFEGFSSDNNELPEHKLRAAIDWYTESGWSFSAHAEGLLFDEETGYGVGFYVQRSF
jgi:hypothetical protein